MLTDSVDDYLSQHQTRLEEAVGCALSRVLSEQPSDPIASAREILLQSSLKSLPSAPKGPPGTVTNDSKGPDAELPEAASRGIQVPDEQPPDPLARVGVSCAASESEANNVVRAQTKKRAAKLQLEAFFSQTRSAQMRRAYHTEQEYSDLREAFGSKFKQLHACELQRPTVGDQVLIIGGPNTGRSAKVITVLTSSKFGSIQDIVAPSPQREVLLEQMMEPARASKIREIMPKFLSHLRGGDQVMQGLMGDPLRRTAER
eukprot:1899725-Prymnesium_polylepis.1